MELPLATLWFLLFGGGLDEDDCACTEFSCFCASEAECWCEDCDCCGDWDQGD